MKRCTFLGIAVAATLVTTKVAAAVPSIERSGILKKAWQDAIARLVVLVPGFFGFTSVGAVSYF